MANIIKQTQLVATTKEAAQKRSKDSLFQTHRVLQGKTLRLGWYDSLTITICRRIFLMTVPDFFQSVRSVACRLREKCPKTELFTFIWNSIIRLAQVICVKRLGLEETKIKQNPWSHSLHAGLSH